MHITLQLWERRSKFVLEVEKERWKDVLPCMMSDEESSADGTIARHVPLWRSEEFNSMVDALDTRANSKSKNARKERVLRSPWKTPSPTNCKPWMIRQVDPEEQ